MNNHAGKSETTQHSAALRFLDTEEGNTMNAQPMNAPQQVDRLLRLRDLKIVTGLGSSTIYRYIQAGTFPAPVKIGGFASRWKSSEVQGWIAGLQA